MLENLKSVTLGCIGKNYSLTVSSRKGRSGNVFLKIVFQNAFFFFLLVCSFDGCYLYFHQVSYRGNAVCCGNQYLWFTWCEVFEYLLHRELQEKQEQLSLLGHAASPWHVPPSIHTVWTCPLPPWWATCTCGVWQTGFLCQEKGLQGMTGGRQNLTPSFSPMQSQDAFPPLNTVGNHTYRVEMKDKLWEEGLEHQS